jgi:hypothetical protein
MKRKRKRKRRRRRAKLWLWFVVLSAESQEPSSSNRQENGQEGWKAAKKLCNKLFV